MTNLYLTLKRWMLRGWVVAVCGLLGLLVAGIMVATTPQTYSASTTLFIGSPASADSTGALQGDSFSQQRATTYAYLFKTEVIAVKVKDDLGLNVSPYELSSAVTATPIDKTVLLDVTAVGDSAQGAADIANAYASNFAQYVGQLEKPNGGGAASVLVSVVSTADPAEAVKGVNPLNNLLMGLVVGAVLGGVLWWILRRFDNSIRTVEELAGAAQAPVVGVLPAVPARRCTAVDFGTESGSAYAEAARKLRTNIEFLDMDNPVRTLVVASASAGEEAQEVAASLALALGEANRGVVLVDADLRCSPLAEYLGLDSGYGLSDVLRGGTDLADVELNLPDRRIVFVPSGTHRRDGVDDLASSGMTDVLVELSRRYDYVVLLAPSVLTFADAASLAARVDGALIVSQRETGTTDNVARAAGVLRSAGSRVLGSVLVGAHLTRTATPDKRAAAPSADPAVNHAGAEQHRTQNQSQNGGAESSVEPDTAPGAHWPPVDEKTRRAAVSQAEDDAAAARGANMTEVAADDYNVWTPAESVEQYTRSDIDPPTVAIRRDRIVEMRPTSEQVAQETAWTDPVVEAKSRNARKSDTIDRATVSGE